MADVSDQLIGEAARTVEPLRVTAILLEGYVGRRPPMLDGLLTDVYAKLVHLLPPHCETDILPIEIPIPWSPCGKVRMCSSGVASVVAHDVRHKQRSAPVIQYARLGNSKITKIDEAAGEDKRFRVPYSNNLIEEHRIDWLCIGDREMISGLLRHVTALGRFRCVGNGRIREWLVEQCDTWGEGFPIIRDGKPMRPLPLDTPGLVAPFKRAFATVRTPYWFHAREELVAVPA